MKNNPAASTCGFCGSARPRQGFARCARRWRGLDPDLRASHGGHLSKRRGVSKKGPDFLDSRYCYEVEGKEALRRHAAGEAG